MHSVVLVMVQYCAEWAREADSVILVHLQTHVHNRDLEKQRYEIACFVAKQVLSNCTKASNKEAVFNQF